MKERILIVYYQLISLFLCFGPASVSPRHANSWVVETKPRTEVIGILNYVPIVCYMFYVISLDFSAFPPFPVSPSLLPSLSYSPSAAAAFSLTPASSIPSYSYHLRATHPPGFCTILSQMPRIGRIEMYCVTVFCLCKM